MKKIIKALVLALCVALAVCAFAVVSSAEAPAGSVAEVEVDGNTNYYNNFDDAWAAAKAGEGAAIVRLIGSASFYGRNDVDDGTNAEDITLDLNGYTLEVKAHSSSNEAFRVLTHGSRFVVCDTSEDGGGAIVSDKRFLTIGDFAFRGACPYFENHGTSFDFVHENNSEAEILIDNVTITCNGANSGDGRAVIWAWILCADIDITNSTINAPNVGLIYIEDNMTLEDHALYIDVADSEINVNTFVVEMLQGNNAAANSLYLQENMTWSFENCNITSNGDGNGYAFFYDVAWNASLHNYVPSYAYFPSAPTNSGSNKSGEMLPTKYAPAIYMNNCTLDTKGDGLVGVRSTADNVVSVYISGGSYKINTDGVADGEKFVNRNNVALRSQKVTLSAYDTGDGYVYPEFNFNPAEVKTSVYGGIYVATAKKTEKKAWTFSVDRTPYLYSVVEKTVGEDTMWVLEDRVFAPQGLLYNLSLSNTLSINLAIPTDGENAVALKQVRDIEGTTIPSNSEKITMDGVTYKVFCINDINIVSTTTTYTFVVVEKNTEFTYTVEVSILDYAKAVLAGDYTAAEKELARSIIAYALEAEKLAAEVNSDAVDALTSALSGIDAPETLSEFAGATITEGLGDTALYGVAIDFGGNAPAFVLALDEEATEPLTVTVSYQSKREGLVTKEYTLDLETKRVTLDAMKAFDFDNDITINVGGTDYVFNLEFTLNGLIALDAENTGFANALYYYVKAAQAYQDEAFPVQ